MSKKQEELTVKEMIEASGILERIEQIREMMNVFQARKILQPNCYKVRRKIYELEKTIELFESQLKDLIDPTIVWESGK